MTAAEVTAKVAEGVATRVVEAGEVIGTEAERFPKLLLLQREDQAVIAQADQRPHRPNLQSQQSRLRVKRRRTLLTLITSTRNTIPTKTSDCRLMNLKR